MENTRSLRRKQRTKLLFKRIFAAAIVFFVVLGLVIIWLYHFHVLFVLLCMSIFFGMMAFNSNNIRSYVPGVNSDKVFVRCLIHVFLLAGSFYIIGIVVLQRL